jgi:hypothetical protein
MSPHNKSAPGTGGDTPVAKGSTCQCPPQRVVAHIARIGMRSAAHRAQQGG